MACLPPYRSFYKYLPVHGMSGRIHCVAPRLPKVDSPLAHRFFPVNQSSEICVLLWGSLGHRLGLEASHFFSRRVILDGDISVPLQRTKHVSLTRRKQFIERQTFLSVKGGSVQKHDRSSKLDIFVDGPSL